MTSSPCFQFTGVATLWFAVVLGLAALVVFRRLAPKAARALEETAPEPPPEAPEDQ